MNIGCTVILVLKLIKMIHFEVLLKELGDIGKAQIILLCLLLFSKLQSGFNSLAPVFISYSPDMRCDVPQLVNASGNLTEVEILNLTTPYDPTDNEYDGCYRYGYDLDSCDSSLSCVNKSYPPIKCDQGYYYDRSVFTETAATEFDLVCDDKYLNTLATSLYYVGMFLGSLIFGNFADLLGRKLCCIVTYVGVLGCMFGLSFSKSMALFTTFRVGIAAFSYGTTIGSFVYTMEIVGKKWRTVFGMCYQIAFVFGYMIMSGVAYRWRNWHDIMFVCSLLSIPFLIIALIIPESPRWLFTKNKEKQAMKITNLMARINKVKLSEGIWEEAKKAGMEIQQKLSSAKRYSSLDLFRQKTMALLTLNVMFSWFVNSFVYYGVSLNAGALAGDIFINNTLNGVMEIASYLLVMILLDRIGRRIILASFFAVAGIALICSVIVNTYAGDNQSMVTLGLAFAFIGKIGISGAFGIIYNYTSELYPTVIRSNGVGVGSMASRVGGFTAPYVISLQDYIPWLPNAIFGVFAIAAALSALAFPETNGQPMLETLDEANDFYKNWKAPNVSVDVKVRVKSSAHDNRAYDRESTKL